MIVRADFERDQFLKRRFGDCAANDFMTLSVAHKIPVEHLSFPGLCPVTDAVADLARFSAEEQRGAVVSRRKVVDFVLDLIGLVPD